MKGIVLKAVLACLASMSVLTTLRAADTPIKVVNPQHGPATVEGADSPYYCFKAKIEIPAGKNVVFRQNTCILVGKDGTKHTDYWIYLAGWSAGVEETKTAPVLMKTLYVREDTKDAKPASKWNTTKPEGAKGAITYTIPNGGFVELYFLWPVPKGFQAKRVILTDLVELDL